jgi:dTDP-glucose 4,6-dehydratase
MKKVLVTGAAGFIGANFVHFLYDNGDSEITIVDKFTYASNLRSIEGLLGSRVAFVEGDIANAELVEELVEKHDVVVNFAAESHNDNSLKDPSPFISSNILGTFAILEAVRKFGSRLHHISTDEVFGDLEIDDTSRFTESTPYSPSSPYSASKASSDLLVRAWVRSFGVNATISNCSNNYGPFQHIEKFIPRQITNLLSARPVKIYGDGLNVRDWIHVDDHSSAILAILQKGKAGETYLIGADGEKSNLDVIRELLGIFELDGSSIEWVRDRAGHDRRYAIDSTKIRQELGWAPKYSDFSAGLESTVEWYKNNREWWAPTKDLVERDYARVGQ